MMFSRLLKKSRKLTMALVLTLALSLLMASGAFALNYNGSGSSGTGNKPLDFNGYSLVLDSNNQVTGLNLYFNKSLNSSQLEQGQFAVYLHGTTSNNGVTSESYTSGNNKSGCTTTNLTNGTTVTLGLNTLSSDTLYDVVIDAATIFSGDGISMANYSNTNPPSSFTFIFRTPVQATGTPYWSDTTPIVTYSLGSSNIPYENNLVAVLDRPLASSASLTSFLSGLSTGYTKGGTQVGQDSNYSETTPVSGDECYYPTNDTSENTFFFPETVNTNSYACYDRDSSGSHSYTLTLPAFTYQDSATTTNTDNTPGSLSFSTVGGDVPGFLNQSLTVSSDPLSGLDVSWPAGTVTPVASQFNVYYWDATADSSHDQFTATYTQDTADTVTGSGPYSINITGLVSGHTYYVRVVPKNSNGTVGYSLAGSGQAS